MFLKSSARRTQLKLCKLEKETLALRNASRRWLLDSSTLALRNASRRWLLNSSTLALRNASRRSLLDSSTLALRKASRRSLLDSSTLALRRASRRWLLDSSTLALRTHLAARYSIKLNASSKKRKENARKRKRLFAVNPFCLRFNNPPGKTSLHYITNMFSACT